MLSLSELRRAVAILDERLKGARLQRIVQPDEYRIVLVFRGPGAEHNILLSCRPEFARISVLPQAPPAPAAPPSFAQYLRAHLSRSVLEGLEIVEDDRLVAVRQQTGEGRFDILLSVLGPRSNIYLLDPKGNVVHAVRPIEETRRDLKLGEPWKSPGSGVPREGDDRWADIPDQDYLDAVEESYRLAERRKEAEILARRIETVLTKDREFLERKAVNLAEDLAEARRAQDFRRQGELLKSVVHNIRTGDEQVAAQDYETGETVMIPLDSKLSPSQNLEAYFERYQKVSRGIGVIEGQLAEVRRSLAQIEALEAGLREAMRASDLDALQALASEPRLRRLIAKRYAARKTAKPAIKAPPGKRETPGPLVPRRYKTEDGLEVWVGRSDIGNDYLTMRLSRGNDLLFHLEGYPGSHVILRTGGKPDPPPGSMLEACELAVHFSKLKNATKADVHVTAVKNVRKPKGAKPGLVYTTGGKTIHLRRDAKRLQNLLAARIDE